MPSATTISGAPACLLALWVALTPFAHAAEPAAEPAATTLIDAAMTRDEPRAEHMPKTIAALVTPVRRTGQCSKPGAATLAAVLPVATDHGSYASGVVVEHGRVLTAAHAVQGASRFFVRTGEQFLRADLISVDHESDLAVLAVDTGSIRPLSLALGGLNASEPVWAVGFPRARALETSSGVFQRVSGGAVHTSASIDSGQSGGGLLSCSRGTYVVAGMLRGYGAYRSGERYVKLDNHSVSVAADTIRHFLAIH